MLDAVLVNIVQNDTERVQQNRPERIRQFNNEVHSENEPHRRGQQVTHCAAEIPKRTQEPDQNQIRFLLVSKKRVGVRYVAKDRVDVKQHMDNALEDGVGQQVEVEVLRVEEEEGQVVGRKQAFAECEDD